MSVAFSVQSTGGPNLDVQDDVDTGHVTLKIVGDTESTSIELDGEDLARALITASPSFAKGVGDIVSSMLMGMVGDE